MLFLFIVSLLAGAAQRQPEREVAPNAVAFRASTKQVKTATLNGLATRRDTVPAGVTGELISAGLADGDDDVRMTALAAAAGRAAAARFGKEPYASVTWRAERAVMLELRPALLRALEDKNEKIRRSAVVALVNLEHEAGAPANAIVLRPDTALALSNRFQIDESASVRTEIAKTFALTTTTSSKVRDAVLVQALSDAASQVVSYGILGLAQSRSPQVERQIAELLKHPHVNVRLQAAQAIPRFGPAGRHYLPQLQESAASESDAAVKSTIEAAINAIIGGQILK